MERYYKIIFVICDPPSILEHVITKKNCDFMCPIGVLLVVLCLKSILSYLLYVVKVANLVLEHIFSRTKM